ncbi:MAG: hypothetical protein PVI01_08510 [Gemmatimonadales bacterium]
MLTSLFEVTARRDGREQAYEFLKDIFQRVAVYSMPAIYQIDQLVQCEGDSFDNFKKFRNGATHGRPQQIARIASVPSASHDWFEPRCVSHY